MATELKKLTVDASNGSFTFEVVDAEAREAAQAAKQTAEKITIPTALPNPKKLIFTGGATGEYDGSKAVTINIPTGGEGGNVDMTGYVKSVNGQTPDENGNVEITIPDSSPNGNGLTTEQINALDGMFRVCAKDTTKDVESAYSAFKLAFDITGIVEYFVAPTKAVVNEINRLSDEWISFVAIADPHGDANMQNSQGIANYLLERTDCDSILLLGDYSTEYWSEAEYSNWVEPLKVNSEQVYPVIGNHEMMGNSDVSIIHADFLAEKTDIVGVPESCYYYRDIEAHKLRMMFINTSETGQYTMSEEQIAWIKETAESLPDSEWHLMVCAHVDIDDLDGVTRSNSTHATEIIEALSSCNGKIVGYFCGHQHIDDARDIGSFYQVLLLNDKLETRNYYPGYSVTDREVGTVSEQAVSVISVNTSTCDVVIRRIGAGKSMVYNYSEQSGDEPVTPPVTLTSISAVYNGGDVAVGTAVADLTGIVVTAHYSDDSQQNVTGYTLSGTIAEGSNTVTVTYQGKTATFTVTGVGEVIGRNVIGVYGGASYTVNDGTNITAYGTGKNQYTYVIVNLDDAGKKVSYNITVDDCSEVIDTQICCSIYGCNEQNATDDTGYTTRYLRAALPADRGSETYSGEIQLTDSEYGVIIYLYPSAKFELSVKDDDSELICLTGEGTA